MTRINRGARIVIDFEFDSAGRIQHVPEIGSVSVIRQHESPLWNEESRGGETDSVPGALIGTSIPISDQGCKSFLCLPHNLPIDYLRLDAACLDRRCHCVVYRFVLKTGYANWVRNANRVTRWGLLLLLLLLRLR